MMAFAALAALEKPRALMIAAPRRLISRNEFTFEPSFVGDDAGRRFTVDRDIGERTLRRFPSARIGFANPSHRGDPRLRGQPDAHGNSFPTRKQEGHYRREALRLWRSVQDLPRVFPGIHIEKKPFSSTLHYRGMKLTAGQEKRIWKVYRERFNRSVIQTGWELHPGKKMIEALPKGFSKAGAVARILKAYPGYLPTWPGTTKRIF